MRAIVQDTYGGTEVLALREIDKPAIADDQVLVAVEAAGVDQGVWHLMSGLPYMVRVMGFGMRAPKLPVRGTEVAGRVEAVGATVTRFRPGDEVFGVCEGSFAAYAPAREDRLAPKPSNVTFDQAAAVPVSGGTALHSLRDKGELEAGQRALIIGAAGGVGTFAVQLAKASGAHVTGVCSGRKAELVRSIGADQTIDYTREDFADGRRQFDLIVDTAGRRSLSHLRRALTPRGTLVIVGGEGGGRWTGGFGRQILRAPLLSLFVGQRLRPVTYEERAEDLEALRARIEADEVTPVVGRTFPLAEAAEAIRFMHDGGAGGKVVLTVESGP